MSLVVDHTLQNAATSGEGTPVDLNATAHELVAFVERTGTITAGEITFKEAPSIGYAGAWDPLEAPTDLIGVGNALVAVRRFSGAFRAIEADITTVITGGGSVTVTLNGARR